LKTKRQYKNQNLRLSTDKNFLLRGSIGSLLLYIKKGQKGNNDRKILFGVHMIMVGTCPVVVLPRGQHIFYERDGYFCL